jgi:glycosyltransferase involved in cell wall biosynthesis
MMIKKIEKALTSIIRILDYLIFVFVFPFCLVGLLFTIPWILKQRRIWNQSAKGSRRALVLSRFTLEKVKKRGYEHLLPFQNPSLEWLGFLDPANALNTRIEITNDLYLVTCKSPNIIRFLKKTGLIATSTIFRDAYNHHYQALEACLVSGFIKIPFMVEMRGNYELIRRLTGKTFYFRKLKRLPIIKFFARIATNWLLGLPLRHAVRVLGRNKCSYEHAFALGAPVERLSLLRINNFNAAFNSYNPAQPPATPAKYPYILLVGRLAKIKYPLDAIAAFDLAASHLPEYHLVIIGDGPIRHDVEQRKERSENKDRIVLMGACPSNIVLNWTAHANVAICPYSGSTLVEAMLCGIPVVAYDIENHAETVIDDYTGFLVPFRNIEALAEKMIYVIRNYEEARIVGMRGRELARVAFDKDKISEKESMYYMQALTDSHS